MNFKTKWDFVLHALEIAILQVRVMGIFPVCKELFPVITATFSRKMSSIFTRRMYRVILPTRILLRQAFHFSGSWQKAQEQRLLPTPAELKWWALCFRPRLRFFFLGKMWMWQRPCWASPPCLLRVAVSSTREIRTNVPTRQRWGAAEHHPPHGPVTDAAASRSPALQNHKTSLQQSNLKN